MKWRGLGGIKARRLGVFWQVMVIDGCLDSLSLLSPFLPSFTFHHDTQLATLPPCLLAAVRRPPLAQPLRLLAARPPLAFLSFM
jgi:hypothetical protein